MTRRKSRTLCLSCHKETARPGYIYCSNQCQRDEEHRKYIENWRVGKYSGVRGKTNISAHIVRYLREKYDNRCSECGWNKRNSQTLKVPLEGDHIDGSWKNNQEDNLRLLCPNCHSLSSTFRSLNRGKGREERRKIYQAGVAQW